MPAQAITASYSIKEEITHSVTHGICVLQRVDVAPGLPFV